MITALITIAKEVFKFIGYILKFKKPEANGAIA